MGKKLTQAQFVERSMIVHGGKYRYGSADYKTNDKHVEIICPIHGSFLQRPVNHMSGRGCPKCKDEACANRQAGSTQTFVNKAKSVHGNTYDYSGVRYVRSNKKVEIICREHGAFWQIPNAHLSGSGCPRCAGKNRTSADFISEAEEIHGETYSYDKTEYAGIKNKVIITCEKHGDFEQTAEGHLAGRGCRFCWSESLSSRMEDEIATFCESRGLAVVRNSRSVLDGIEIDIFVPQANVGIEVNGCYWHSDQILKRNSQGRDKLLRAKSKGIRLIHIWDFDWRHKRPVSEHMILHATMMTERKTNARDCGIRAASSPEASRFYRDNHIQGPCRGAVLNLALVDKSGSTVAMMSFTQGGTRRGKSEPHEYELTRYASVGVVRGGAGKLFRHAVDALSARRVWSFSDDQYFSGRLYEILGFSKDEEIKPDYKIVHPYTLKTWHKSLWQRRHIPRRVKELGSSIRFDPKTDRRTEREIQDLLRVLRVYDCGKTRWLWTSPNSSSTYM